MPAVNFLRWEHEKEEKLGLPINMWNFIQIQLVAPRLCQESLSFLCEPMM